MLNENDPRLLRIVEDLRRRYKIECRSVELSGARFDYWAPQDIEELIREVAESDFQKDERLPYWCHLWPSAICLQQFLAAQTPLWAGQRVLELGCGLGMNSFFLQRQASHLISIDYELIALQFARLNVILNSDPSCDPRFPFCAMDWRNPAFKGPFDVMIGSDVLYEKRFFAPIIDLIDNFMAPQARLIFSEPGRTVSQGFIEQLLDSGRHQTRHLIPYQDSAAKIDQQVVIHVFESD